jgi:hypothetical protein
MRKSLRGLRAKTLILLASYCSLQSREVYFRMLMWDKLIRTGDESLGSFDDRYGICNRKYFIP